MPFNPNDFNLSIEIKVVNLVSCSVIELVFFPAREKKKRAGGEGNCRLSLSLSLPRLFACLPGWLAPSGGGGFRSLLSSSVPFHSWISIFLKLFACGVH